jgi:AraC-like DNA-binding protein
MRQIVQLNKPIVQEKDNAWKTNAIITGRAHVRAWHGEAAQIEWNLDQAIGFLLVTEGQIEAECAAGNKTQLHKGDLLILNESSVSHAAFFLDGGISINASDASPSAEAAIEETMSRALHGSIEPAPAHAHWHARPFASNPARAMAVARLSEREFTRTATLAQLLADETAGATIGSTDTARLIATMEATLFEALVGVLRERDPMSMPQLAGSSDKQLQKALLAMIDAPEKPWRIESMAREAAMSRTAFAVRFKEVLGQTPLGYLTALRIQHAMTLLAATPQQTIDSVARDVGYADESALRRAYERAVGEPFKRSDLAAQPNH